MKIARRVGRKQGGSIGQHMTRIGQQSQRTGKKTTNDFYQHKPGSHAESIQQATSIIIFWQV